jgi:hypothetical protein
VRHASLRLADGAWTVECPPRTTALRRVEPEAARRMIAEAAWRKPLWKRRSVALARDEAGRYYFVDRLRDEHGGKGLRLFVGKKGRLVEQKLRDAVDDSAGLILESRAGVLHVDFVASTARWRVGKKKTPLTFLPLETNVGLIYADLGVYRTRIGVPCDDL